ncbi:hypothetical protein GJ744_003069 [Endocarpon pusillum]|uniref:Uncharacterized protein n=1 Tax=Endocarpon pusillum TaxID=364733 RepID=A0A8H7AB23_9EURO|nr:hypothetical protein GJ744_003069 [Endocarpon pusillum]
MKSLPDHSSLLSLLQTCRSLSGIFDYAGPQILQAILSQLFHPRTIPEAVTVRSKIFFNSRRRRKGQLALGSCKDHEDVIYSRAVAATSPSSVFSPLSAAPNLVGPPAQRWITTAQ